MSPRVHPEARGFFELDVDEEPGIAARFNSRAIPFFVFHDAGKQVKVDVRGGHPLDPGPRLLRAARG